MIAFAILCAVLVGFIALALYLDAIGFDPFADLYGSDYSAPWRDREPGDLDVR